jgi:DNA-binding transcriptional MerR regulator
MVTELSYSAEQLARAAKCTRKAVRVYAAKGLLGHKTARRRGFGPIALMRLRLIVNLRRVGLSLAQIGRIMRVPESDRATPAQAATLLERGVEDAARLVSEQIELLQRTREDLMATREALRACSHCEHGYDHCAGCVETGKLGPTAAMLLMHPVA